MRIGFAANLSKNGVAAYLDALAESARQRGHVCTLYDDAQSLDCADCPPEILTVIGGDGTLLRYARSAGALNIPILGVNQGRIGFLSEVLVEEFPAALDRLESGDYALEHRMMLSGSVNGGKPVPCLNDILVFKRSFSGTAEIEMFVNGMRVADVFCDGIIAATPTGSTAYSLSAGGPVTAPGMQCTVITPVCSHTLHVRPIVSDPSDVWEFRLRGEGFVAADGMKVADVERDDRVRVTRAKETVGFIRFSDKNVFELIENKLS